MGKWSQGFSDHLDSSKVLTSSLFTEFKVRVEDFFKARKACCEKVFSSCLNNLRADHLKTPLRSANSCLTKEWWTRCIRNFILMTKILKPPLRRGLRRKSPMLGPPATNGKGTSRMPRRRRVTTHFRAKNVVDLTTSPLRKIGLVMAEEGVREVVLTPPRTQHLPPLLNRTDVGERLLGFQSAWRLFLGVPGRLGLVSKKTSPFKLQRSSFNPLC